AIAFERGATTDDGVACALEYNVVAWGRTALAPQAGLAVHVRGDHGRLPAGRGHDDGDPPPPPRPAAARAARRRRRPAAAPALGELTGGAAARAFRSGARSPPARRPCRRRTSRASSRRAHTTRGPRARRGR